MSIKGASIDAPRGLGCGEGSGAGAVPLVLLHFECYFCKFVYDGWVALGRSLWLNCSVKQRQPGIS